MSQRARVPTMVSSQKRRDLRVCSRDAALCARMSGSVGKEKGAFSIHAHTHTHMYTHTCIYVYIYIYNAVTHWRPVESPNALRCIGELARALVAGAAAGLLVGPEGETAPEARPRVPPGLPGADLRAGMRDGDPCMPSISRLVRLLAGGSAMLARAAPVRWGRRDGRGADGCGLALSGDRISSGVALVCFVAMAWWMAASDESLSSSPYS
jgi:hypothetical protein